MKPTILFRDVTSGEELDSKVKQGVQAVYDVAKAAYGPGAGNVLLEQSYGDPKLSRDGVTNVQKVFLKDHVANMAARVVIQASKKNNQTVGDGTTAAVILAYHLYNAARKLVAAGNNRMSVARSIEQAADKAVEYIESVSHEVTAEQLLDVAKVSCGDDALGELIADTVNEVGSESGVLVEEHHGLGVYNEIIDGFYMRKGFTDFRLIEDYAGLKSSFTKVPILLLGKTITEGREMKAILERVMSSGHNRLVILGDVMGDALDILVRRRVDFTRTNGAEGLIPTLVSIPATAGMKSVALEDLAVLTGGKVYQDGQKASAFDITYLGAAKKVSIDEHSTIIVDGAGDTEDIKSRLADLEAQLENEVTTIATNALKDRIAHLRGKVGIIHVGAATDVDREELRLRVDDAVCALQAARKGGVVPGGGTTLARVTGTAFDEAFKNLFLDLVENSGENGYLKLGKMLEKEVGYGYDLKNPSEDPIDLREAGILDPTLVMTEVVRNSSSVAAKLVTATASITFNDEGVQLQ